jgi:hypothetical protein
MRKMRIAVLPFVVALVLAQAFQVGVAQATPPFMLMSYSTCRNVNSVTSEPIDLTDEFSRNDVTIYAWFMIGYTLPTNATYTWKWYDPTGSLYKETYLNHSGNGPCSIYGEPLEISKIPLEKRLGLWFVEVYIDDSLLFKQKFTIGKYIVAVNVKGLPKALKTILTIDGNRTEEIQGATDLLLQFDEDTSHTLLFERMVDGEEGIRYVNASTAGPFEVSARRAVSIVYSTQYYLDVASSFGNPQGSGWYDQGAMANFSVTSPVYDYVATKHTLTGWTGDYVGTESTGTIQMDGPRTVEALWESDYTLTYILAIAILAVVVVLIVVKTRTKKQDRSQAT